MREFTNMTIVPGSWFIAVDGEGYHCRPFIVPDLKGNTRTIPGDRILAIQWHGQHQHGQVEGHGAGEGFFDRTQVEPYLKHWLEARAAMKRQHADGLARKRQQELGNAASSKAILATFDLQLVDLGKELASARDERKSHVQAQIDVATRQRAMVVEQMDIAAARTTTPKEIESAKAAADHAEVESAGD